MDDAAQVPGSPDQNNDFDLTFLSAANATFIAEMNAAWRRDPSAVDPRWARYFEQLNTIGDVTAEIERGPSWARNGSRIVGATDPADSVNAVAASTTETNLRDTIFSAVVSSIGFVHTISTI